ncbi:MAG: dTDP-4-dehydrorhamnose reductase [Myxococcaceae bacterium]|nr:dTDP-4-dehydrorhamnose reductase [Myxococcaceae bacterium]
MSYVIIGGRGMLGRALSELFTREKRPFRVLDLPDFDVTKRDHIEALWSGHVTALLNCAAYTNVDTAEKDEAAATKLNGEAVALLAETSAKHDVPLVHYSTDYVFAGDAKTPYRVDQPHAPLNAYGRSKAVGERALWDAKGPHLLLRTSWLYAPWANNFVRTIFKASRERESLKVVADQLGRPTSAEHLAQATLALLDKSARGTLHVTDGGQCTWHEFAAEIVRIAGHAARVDPCTTEEFPRPAKRPAYSVLDLAPTEALLGPMPRWQDSLADVMARLEPV